jgi:ElaB/YqjD/DUF883 family membrane-anchored ribosome-binding protein
METLYPEDHCVQANAERLSFVTPAIQVRNRYATVETKIIAQSWNSYCANWNSFCGSRPHWEMVSRRLVILPSILIWILSERQERTMEHNGPDKTDKIRDFASQMSERDGSAKEQASEAAHRTAAKVGDQMKSVAERVRQTGPRVEAALHSTAESIADRLDRGGAYFRERQYEQLASKASAYIRKNPVTSLIVGVVTGLLLARKVRR